MIQVNLIPDVKLQYIRAQKTKDLVIAICFIVAGASIAVVVLLSLFWGVLSGVGVHTSGRIDEEYKKLTDVQDVGKLVTTQHQLAKITSIHEGRSMNSRIFSILQAILPEAKDKITFREVRVNPDDRKIFLTGSVKTGFKTIEVLKKTISQAQIEYSVKAEGAKTEKAEESVTLAVSPESVLITEANLYEGANGDKSINFEIEFEYTEGILSNNMRNISIVLPTGKVDVTDSKRRLPDSLFSTQNDSKKDKEEKK